MNKVPLICAALALLATSLLINGCVSKAKADAQARAAYLAGQQQAMQQLQGQGQARGPNITVLGEVKNKLLPWTFGLTLAKAIAAAEYYGPNDPAEIIIIRNGERIQVDPRRLLSGDDMPLQPRDIIALRSGP